MNNNQELIKLLQKAIDYEIERLNEDVKENDKYKEYKINKAEDFFKHLADVGYEYEQVIELYFKAIDIDPEQFSYDT